MNGAPNGTPHAGSTGAPVVALHCSGSDGRQWRKLGLALGPAFDIRAPDLYGCTSTGPWQGTGRFTLAHEAEAIVSLIDGLAAPVHLVGHSYGGGVALRGAIERPRAIRSLVLYEPSAFHLLKQMGGRGFESYSEIRTLADDVAEGVARGANAQAARRFIDYWNGPGAWDALTPEIRSELLGWLPKAPLDFQALIEEQTRAAAYRSLDCAFLVLRGEHAPKPSRLISEEIARIVPGGRVEIVAGAGHMGPLSHGEEVASLIASHIRSVEQRCQRDAQLDRRQAAGNRVRPSARHQIA